jgi:hypothetical protein
MSASIPLTNADEKGVQNGTPTHGIGVVCRKADAQLRRFIQEHNIKVLNVAGPRATSLPLTRCISALCGFRRMIRSPPSALVRQQ